MKKESLRHSPFFKTFKGFCDQGKLQDAVQQLAHHCTSVSTNLLYCLLQACIDYRNLHVARQVQVLIKSRKLHTSAYLGSHLIRLFAVCGSLTEAQDVFFQLPRPNVFAWSEIILAHAKLGKGKQAIKMYLRMQKSGLHSDGHTYVAVLQACASIQDLDHGKVVHRHISESGFALTVFVASSLVDMYVQCGKLTDAYDVFERTTDRNVVLWNAMIAGYAQHGYMHDANRLFQCMHRDGIHPNKETWNAIISGWAINGQGDKALGLLQQMQSMGVSPNHVTWNGLIVGFVQFGKAGEALHVFNQMQQEGPDPNHVTYISILKACYGITALNTAKLVYNQITEKGYGGVMDNITRNTVIKMYAACGSLEDACEVFDGLAERDVDTWNSMISGYACYGMNELALTCFEGMLQEGVKPDIITFTCLLSACCHLGLVHEACKHFTSMREVYGITPIQEHINCMIDLLGRTGSLIEAIDLLCSVPFQPTAEAWRSLLTHCGTHNDVELGKQCYGSVVAIDKTDSAGYVLMSNIFVNVGVEDGCQCLKHHNYKN